MHYQEIICTKYGLQKHYIRVLAGLQSDSGIIQWAEENKYVLDNPPFCFEMKSLKVNYCYISNIVTLWMGEMGFESQCCFFFIFILLVLFYLFLCSTEIMEIVLKFVLLLFDISNGFYFCRNDLNIFCMSNNSSNVTFVGSVL